MALPPFLLASTSPRRRELLREIVNDFEVVGSLATELHDASLPPRHLCEVNAQRKAWEVAERHPDHLVLGADTLVFLDQQPLGKPADLDHARHTLARLSGRIHSVITGVCLVHRRKNRMQTFAEVTHVQFKTLPEPVIEEYLREVPVLDKAGAYAIQQRGELLVERIEGSLSNVIGLPVEALRAALQGWR